MAGNEEVIAPNSPGTVTGSPGELVLQNGRLSGARRPLAASLTLIGHADGCHIRLSLPGVSAFHCALVAGMDGLTLEDLKSQTGTLVNGEPVTTRVLKTGDLLSIGPCRFRVRLGSTAAAVENISATQQQGTDAEAIRREKDALRIQAAAVAAQQIALLEKERRLQQSKVALEQQELQLASHLEEKRQRLGEFREQCQEARAALKQERALHEQHVAQTSRELDLARGEIADSQRQLNVERRRLLVLRQRLKQRLHRHWQAERASIGSREALLAKERHSLEKRINLLEAQKQAFSNERLRVNGEIELSRRQLQVVQEEFRQTQRQWEERRTHQQRKMQENASGLEDRVASLAEAEQDLAAQQARWGKRRLKLEKEVEGLENRINNYRRRLGALRGSGAREAGATEREEQQPSVAGLPIASDAAPADAGPLASSPGVDGDYERRLAALDAVAGELADQRLHLVEECERFLRAQQSWRRDHEAAAAELETLTRNLERREQGILQAEEESRRRIEEARQTTRQLEGRQAELTLRTTTWEGERDRWAAELRSREEGVERRLAALAELRRQWTERRHQEVSRLHEEFNLLKKLTPPPAPLRAEWVRQHARVADRQRDLAERALALEQYKQQYVVSSGHPAVAEKHIQLLRREWTDASASARQELASDRKTLDFQMSRLQELFRRTRKLAGEVAVRAAHQSEREAAEEHKEALTASDSAKIRQELRSLRAHRAVSEREIAALRDEVERLARLLIDESPNTSHTTQQAA